MNTRHFKFSLILILLGSAIPFLITTKLVYANQRFSEIDGVSIWCSDACISCDEPSIFQKKHPNWIGGLSNGVFNGRPKAWPYFIKFENNLANVSIIKITWDSNISSGIDSTEYYKDTVAITDTEVSWSDKWGEFNIAPQTVRINRITLETNLDPSPTLTGFFSNRIQPEQDKYICKLVGPEFFDTYVNDYKYEIMDELLKLHEADISKRKF